MTKRALITGITGQDGSYMAGLLLGKGYEVHGLIRRASTFNTWRIDHLYVDRHSPDARLFLHYGDLSDDARLVTLITLLADIITDEVYQLAAQSHVRVSFEEPEHTYPVEFLSDNIRIQVNVLDAARETDMERLLFLGSSCIYPKFAQQLIREEPNDFSPTDSHSLPALIRRYDEAAASGTPSVTTNWGTGSPRRQFLHVDDMADACLYLLEHYEGPDQINFGSGTDVTIREIAEIVGSVAGYTGDTEWGTTKPDGTRQKLLGVLKLAQTGWTSRIGLQEGIERTVAWRRRHVGALRGYQRSSA